MTSSESPLASSYRELLKRHGFDIPSYIRATFSTLQELQRAMIALDESTGITTSPQEFEPRDVDSVNRGYNGLLQETAIKIEQSIRNLRLRLEHDVFVGEFPTSSINAQARRVHSGVLVLINRGLMTFLYEVLKVTSLSWQFADFQSGRPVVESAVGDSGRDPDEIGECLADLILAYVAGTARQNPAAIAPGYSKSIMIGSLLDQCERFVVAHEYGHILMGHLDKPRYRSVTTAVGDIEFVFKDWEMEFEADEMAAQVVLDSVPRVIDDQKKSFALQIAVNGPLMLFALDELLTKAWNECQGLRGFPLVTDHPPPMLRAAALCTYFERSGIPESAIPLVRANVDWILSMETRILKGTDGSVSATISPPRCPLQLFRRSTANFSVC